MEWAVPAKLEAIGLVREEGGAGGEDGGVCKYA
jgi:hypothetical protein